MGPLGTISAPRQLQLARFGRGSLPNAKRRDWEMCPYCAAKYYYNFNAGIIIHVYGLFSSYMYMHVYLSDSVMKISSSNC